MLELRARSIHVTPSGSFQIGNASSPYLSDARITLTGAQTDSPLSLQDGRLQGVTNVSICF